MASPTLPFIPSKKVSEGIVQYCKETIDASLNAIQLRDKLEYIDTEFYRENVRATAETLQARLANRVGNKRVIQDVIHPIVEPQIETSLSYLTSVFLTGIPIFGVVAPPAAMQQAKSMEAVVAENSTRGGWIGEFLMFFRDGLKYNLMAMELDWCEQTIYTPVETIVPGKQNGTQNKELIWAGNKLRRMDLYNTFFDLRCQPHEVHKKGEFVGYIELYSRIALKQFIQDLPTKTNVTEALAAPNGEQLNLYYIPKVNPFDNFDKSKLVGQMNWLNWAGLGPKQGLDYRNIYQVVTRYIRIIPSDFNMPVPKPNQPQVWKVITVNDQVVIYMERLTNAHNFLPIVFGQPYNDGLGLQTKGMGEKLIPLQDLASASWNARLQMQRRKVSDRALYDPLRINPNDVNSEVPNAKIPVKASAYGKAVQDAYHAIPFEDNQTGSFVQDAREFANFANAVSGQNPAQQGQFVKGNKTKVEYEDVQGHSTGRQRMNAIFIESQILSPLKEMLKLNILQYQPDGEITNPYDGKTYNVNKEALRKLALTFKMSDGLEPAEKLMSGETLQVAIQVMGSSPILQQRYDFVKAFTYLMSLQGADLSPFELQEAEVNERQQGIVDQETNADIKKEAGKAVVNAAAAHMMPQPMMKGQ